MITISLFGHLREFVGHSVLTLNVGTAAEAVRAIDSQFRGFKQLINQNTLYEIIIDGGNRAVSNIFELVNIQIEKTLIICPIISGAGAIARIIVGVALVGISFFMPAVFLGLSSTTIGLFGASLIVGGIIQLLSPQTQTYNGNNFDASNTNRAVQGQPVPILFGYMFFTPVLISTWVTNSNVDVHYNPLPQQAPI